jgi:hypothetical protein
MSSVGMIPRRTPDDPAVIFFAPWFIRDPDWLGLTGWSIDYTTAICCDPTRNIEFHHHICFEGVVVKWLDNQEIWRLTGRLDRNGYFEARWPD